MKYQNSIIEIVCVGNYCRSPVAENILKNKLNSSEIIVRSSGLSPVNRIGMDKRSLNYLNEIGLEPEQHFPKRFQLIELPQAV